MHKAGTHMLTDAVAKSVPLKYNNRGVYNHAFSRTWPEAKRQKNTSAQMVIDFFKNNLWPGEIIRGHVEYDAKLASMLKNEGVQHLLIIRKPLDMLLSLANWWERHDEIPTNVFNAYKKLNKDCKLEFLLTGEIDGNSIWPNLIERTEFYLPWLTDENTLVLRYEDVIINPESAAEKVRAYSSLPFNNKNFLRRLKNRSNKTFTKPEDKVFKEVPAELIMQYKKLGGEELEQKLSYTS